MQTPRASRPVSLKSRINLAFSLALLILTVVAFASYRNIVRLRADVNWMEHTYQTSRTIRILFLQIAEAESGQRGFVISANQAFVERFSLAEQSIPATLDTLRELTKDNSRQQRRMDTLQQLVAKNSPSPERICGREEKKACKPRRKWWERVAAISLWTRSAL